MGFCCLLAGRSVDNKSETGGDIGKSTRIFANLFLTHFSDNTPLCRFYRFFLKIMNRDVDNKNSIHNSAKQVVLPVH